MRERIARAIEASMFAPHELPVSAELHERYLKTADNVLAAMRDPTPGVTNAVRNIADESILESHNWSGKQLWEGLIDAALAEKETPK